MISLMAIAVSNLLSVLCSVWVVLFTRRRVLHRLRRSVLYFETLARYVSSRCSEEESPEMFELRVEKIVVQLQELLHVGVNYTDIAKGVSIVGLYYIQCYTTLGQYITDTLFLPVHFVLLFILYIGAVLNTLTIITELMLLAIHSPKEKTNTVK